MTDTLLYWKAPDGTRTRDLLITNQSLYQLSHGSALNRTILWYQRQRVLSREKWKFTRYVTKALRCNGFVAGQNSAGSFYALSYYTLLWKTCFKCPPRESHSPSGFATILVSVNFYLSLKYSSGSKVRASAGVRWYTGGSKYPSSASLFKYTR